MDRFWLVEPDRYPGSDGDLRTSRTPWLARLLPPMRFHLIWERDQDRHPHDHPWEFQTLILEGGYT
jgi:hypothetical protein